MLVNLQKTIDNDGRSGLDRGASNESGGFDAYSALVEYCLLRSSSLASAFYPGSLYLRVNTIETSGAQGEKRQRDQLYHDKCCIDVFGYAIMNNKSNKYGINDKGRS